MPQGKRKRKAHGAGGRRRANQTGTLERRGNGHWLARWYVYTPQGERLRKSRAIRAATLADAERQLRDLTEGNALVSREKVIRARLAELDAVRGEIERLERERPALAIADAFDAYLRSPDRPQSGARTLDGYEAQFRRFAGWMARRFPDVAELRGVTRSMAAAYLAELAADASPNTYNKHASLLRLVWRVIGAEARCTSNPWENVRRKVQPKTNGRRALTLDELARVCSPLTGEMRVLFALGLYTGLRLGDCALMEWGAVDMARRVIVTTPRKTARTGRTVEIPIHPALLAMLAGIPPERRRGHVLPETAELYGRDDSGLARRIQAVFEAAGIETGAKVAGYARGVTRVGFHSLRHTFVSLMGNAGAPLALVQSIVGHSSPMMTAHYFHARTDALADAVSTLPQPVQFAPVEPTADTRQPTQNVEVDPNANHGARADGEETAADAREGVCEREECSGRENVPPDGETRLRAFYAAYAALSPSGV
jgi:integrase